VLDGEFKIYGSNDSLVKNGSYNKGKFNGEEKEYFENGQVKIIRNFKNDELDGDFKEFDFNGQLIKSSTFKKGRINGKYISYYDNGNVESI